MMCGMRHVTQKHMACVTCGDTLLLATTDPSDHLIPHWGVSTYLWTDKQQSVSEVFCSTRQQL